MTNAFGQSRVIFRPMGDLLPESANQIVDTGAYERRQMALPREGLGAGQELGAGEERDGKGLVTDEGTGGWDRRGPHGQLPSL
jgi:hypothetical protein